MVLQPPGPALHTHLTCASPLGMMAAELQADSMSRHSGEEPGSGQTGALPVHSSGRTPKMGRLHSETSPVLTAPCPEEGYDQHGHSHCRHTLSGQTGC